jgi:hypothetical protein
MLPEAGEEMSDGAVAGFRSEPALSIGIDLSLGTELGRQPEFHCLACWANGAILPGWPFAGIESIKGRAAR